MKRVILPLFVCLGVFIALALIPTARTASAQESDGGNIQSAETKIGAIFPLGDTDAYSFNAQTGQGIVIQMNNEDSLCRPVIDLYAPSGILEKRSAIDYYHCYAIARIDNYTLKETGTYTIVAWDTANYIGNYSLSLVLIPGATVSPQDGDGGNIQSAETKKGAISPRADTDAYSFNAQTGQGIVIQMNNEDSLCRPVIDLYAPSGVLEERSAIDYYHCYAIARIDNYTLKETGTYTIVAWDTANYTGNYSLSLVLMPPPKELAVITLFPATNFTMSSTTLNGILLNLGIESSVEVSFEWGLDTNYGSEKFAQTMTNTGAFSANLENLMPDTTYHFRAKAVGVGTAYGNDMFFTILSGGFQIPLKAGWNMVSVPVVADNSSVSAVFPGVAAVYTWNPATKSYVTPTTVLPEKGYWVAVTADKTITVSGTPVTSWNTAIKAGWNMIGSVIDNASIASPNDNPDGSVQPFAYSWDAVAKSYVMTTTIGSGKGNWVASIRDCTLTMP